MTETPRSTPRFFTPVSPWRSWWDSEKLNDARLMKRVWGISRVCLFLEWALMRFTLADTKYYFRNIHRMGEMGPAMTMPEYPTPVLWLLKIPDLFSFGHQWAYSFAFFCFMFALDAAFTWTLWHDGSRLRGKAVAFWSAFVPMVGITAYLRYDMVTAVLAGWSLLLLRRQRPAASGALMALGASLKLWPALLWPALLGDREHGEPKRNRIWASVGFWGGGIALALVSLLWAGWDRLVSPLGWQSSRGLQIESVWATIPMVLRLFHRHDYWVAISEFNAWEISGPTTHFFLTLASASTVIGLVLAMIAYALWLRRGDQRLIEGAALMLLIILVLIVTNKTFSPQYIIWLGGPMAACWAMASENQAGTYRAREDEHNLAEISEWVLLLTLLTQLVYPISYAALVGHMAGIHGATFVLAARNTVLVWVLVKVCLWIWSFLFPRPIEATNPRPERNS